MALLLVACTRPLHAQREYAVGMSANLVAGGDTNPRTGLGGGVGQPDRTYFFYGVYPSVSLASEGARSNIDLVYAFGLNRTRTDPESHSESHSATISLLRTLGPTWNMTLSDEFQLSSDLSTFNAFQGIPSGPDDVPFLFDAVAIDLTSRNNDATLALQHLTGPRTSFTVTGTYDLRSYSENTFTGIISDQQSVSGGVVVDHQIEPDTFLSLGYTTRYSSFRDFDAVLSHHGYLGLATEIVPDLTLKVTAGPSYVTREETSSNYLSYDASASLERQLDDRASMAVYYSFRSGYASGLGSVSDTRRAGISFSRPGGPVDLFVDASVFDSRGRFDTSDSFRGAFLAAKIGFPLTDTLLIAAGANYQRYTVPSTPQFELQRERLYLSLVYDDPGVWRFFD